MATKKSRRSGGDGALFYRADRDRWMGRISVNGKPRTVSTRTKTEARYKLDQLRRAADDGIPVITRDRTVAELLELWRTKALPNRDLSPARIASHDWAIRILTHELGGIKLQALTVDDVEAALARRTIPADEQPTPRKGRGRAATSALSRNSLIKLRSTLSQALTWAQRRDLVTRNVAALAELPTGATTQRTGKSLTVEQARQLLATASGTELEAMWTLMLYLGLRPGEAAGLSWNDIDFTNGTIHIWRARTTNTDGSVTIGNTKTPGSIRTLEAPRRRTRVSGTSPTTTRRPRRHRRVRRGRIPTTWCSPHPPDGPPTQRRSATSSTGSSPLRVSRGDGHRTCCGTRPPA